MVENEGIDFVILWVDGNDPEWQKVYKKCRFGENSEKDFSMRYREWGTLKYWFRGVEKFAPWVRKIHFVTWGHLPSWLDVNNPKIHIVKHEDYIPEEFLPTFNSTVLEKFLHRIEGLSERFVFFNDDMFCVAPLKETDFFQGNKTVDLLSFEPICAYSYPLWGYTKLNESTIFARHFKKLDLIKENRRLYFSFKYPLKYRLYNYVEQFYDGYTSFLTPHNPSPMLKSVYEEVWACEEEALTESAKDHFRDKADVSQVVFRVWNLLKGNFVPVNAYKRFSYLPIVHDTDKAVKLIKNQKVSTICLNDDCSNDDEFKQTSPKILDAFDSILHDKCSFEK